MEFKPGLEMLADGGVKKGAQDFKMSPRNWEEMAMAGREENLQDGKGSQGKSWEIRMKV